MTARYECDRCGTVDELHTREIDWHTMGSHATRETEGGGIMHLCGFCWQQFHEWRKRGIT